MTPTFTVVFDTELVWGSFDHMSTAAFDKRYPGARATLFELISLIDSYEISATWAVVGHLFLESCARDASGMAHAEIVRTAGSRGKPDWYSADPCTSRHIDPLWYGDDVVDALMSTRTPQEIGCHSFGHALFDDPNMTAEAARSDLEACISLARQRGLTLKSFVFPRNREGHYDVLKSCGFTSFRGADPTWHSGIHGLPGRAAHLLDQTLGLRPPVSQPSEVLPGLWKLPGSMLFLHRSGARRLVSTDARTRKASRGLRAAMESGGVFTLWTHPFNLASDPQNLLAALGRILRQAVDLRDRGLIAIESMSEVAARMSGLTQRT